MSVKYAVGVLMCAVLVTGCGDAGQANEDAQQLPQQQVPHLVGQWITESNGMVMGDPQTSGLSHWRGKLIGLSDGSAQEDQRRRLHLIDPATASLSPKPAPMSMASRVRRSCFSAYLSDQPDLEALVVDPVDDSIVYVVTEDATRTGALSARCQQRFANTGSTAYPTLLIRVKLDDTGAATMTHVRPMRFALEHQVGDFPNDGIEGMAITTDRTLYLGLEKDKAGSARIFSVELDDKFWNSTEFFDVDDPALQLPTFLSGNHPINGLTWLPVNANHPGYLIAAARNDDELWIIDLAKQRETYRQPLLFSAAIAQPSDCGMSERLDNTSLEGIAVIDQTVWLVNDPWKRNYQKNIQCQDNADNFNAMAPLLFSLPVNPDWF